MSRFFNKTLFLLPTFIIGLASGLIYNAYYYSRKPSKFQLAAEQLGFTQSQQEALLKIFYLAGYLEAPNLWHDLSFFDNTDHIQKMYKSAIHSLNLAHTKETGANKFNLKILRKNLFKDVNEMDIQDVEAWILYTAQNAFNRKLGQERLELNSQDWMTKYENEYLEAAKTLGLIDEIPPKQQQYDESWIAGASRIGMLGRIIYFNQLLNKLEVKGVTKILAGERPLWAEIDGIEPAELDKLLAEHERNSDVSNSKRFLPVKNISSRTNEGKEYLQTLAEINKIKLDSNKPFIEYQTAKECPKGYFPARTYPNYSDPEGSKLTESLMAKDLLIKFLNNKATVINTRSENDQRPNTATTARDAALELVAKIQNANFGGQKEFHILFVTNNPYIERQTIATQGKVDEILKESKLDQQGYKITIEGVGFASKQDIPVIHSELAALLAEKYKDVANDKYKTEELLYQTRPNNEASDNTLPLIGDSRLTILDKIQIIFDNYQD